MVTMGEVQPCHIHPLIDKFDGIVGMFCFGPKILIRLPYGANSFGPFGCFGELVKEKISRERMQKLRSDTIR